MKMKEGLSLASMLDKLLQWDTVPARPVVLPLISHDKQS